MLNKFIPDYHIRSIYNLDLNLLKEHGIKLILLDLDNTLIPYNKTNHDDKLLAYKEQLEANGFKLCILSNSKKARVENFSIPFGIDYIKFSKKPLKKGFKEAFAKYNDEYKIDEVCEIGDQIMTDVLGANRMGVVSILVDPIDRSSELFITKMNRVYERIVLFFLKRFKKNKYNSNIKNYIGDICGN